MSNRNPEDMAREQRQKAAKPVALSLSEYDRGIIKLMLDAVPWSGGEEGISARLELENTLRVTDLLKRGPDFPLDKLGRVAATYKLAPLRVDLLVAILCGGGGSPAPAVGRLVAELVGRIRKQCPRRPE